MKSTAAAQARILVTGAGGFVGQCMVGSLRRAMPEATIVAAGRARSDADGVSYVTLDVRDSSQIRDILGLLRPTGIVHLAAVTSIPEARADPRLAWDVNLGGTMNLVQAALEAVPGCRFVYAGTSEIYGPRQARDVSASIAEDGALRPGNTYAVSKAAADLMIGDMAAYGLDAIRFRPFNHTGPGQSERFVISAFAAQLARIEAGLQPPTIRVGDLTATRDFVDVRDIVEAYLKAITLSPASTPPNAVFNLGSGKLVSIREVLDRLIALAKVDVTVEVDPERLTTQASPSFCSDSSAARDVLKWSSSISLDETLVSVLTAWRERLRATSQ